MRTRLVTASALFVAVSIVAACGGDDSSASTSTFAPLVTTVPPPATTTTIASPVTTAAPATTLAPTTTAVTSTTVGASTTTATSVQAAATLVLSDTGLGDAAFGADPDEVVSYVRSILGPPTRDSGWVDPLQTFGVCPGNEVRGVTWHDLQLLFSDESIVLNGRRHFFNYVYGPASGSTVLPDGMRTANGIGIGSSVADLRAAYPDAQVYPEEIFGPYFVVNENFTGFLTGVTDADTIISFIGGLGCGE